MNEQHLGFSSREVLGLCEEDPSVPLLSVLLAPELSAQPWTSLADLLEVGSALAIILLSLRLDASPSSSLPHSSVLTLPSPPFPSPGADAQIAVMQQRIDRLALLNEKQAASPLEPRELEELRGKNER